MTLLAAVFYLLGITTLPIYGGGATEPSVEEGYVPCNNSCNNGLCDYTCGTCVCYPFYTGEYCDRPLIRPCGSYYCFNEGTCQVDGSGKEHCHCPDGYTGEYCLINDTFWNCSCDIVNYDNVTVCNSSDNRCESSGAGTNEALQPCENHCCYYGGTCINNTCHCPTNTFGVYCEYVYAPSGRLTLDVEGHATSATLSWHHPVGYEGIASSGGVRYVVSIENLATGQMGIVMASDTSITQTLVHSTEYCFSARAEVSGGVGKYSESKCYTTPGLFSVVSIATPGAVALVLILLTVLTLIAICYYWRMKCHRAKGQVDIVEMTHFDATTGEYDAVMDDTINEYMTVNTNNNYQDIDAAVEMNLSQTLNGEKTADVSVKADENAEVLIRSLRRMNKDNDAGEGIIPAPITNINGEVNVDRLSKADVTSIYSDTYI